MWDIFEDWYNDCCDAADEAAESMFPNMDDVHEDDQKVTYKSNGYFYDAYSIVQSSVSSWSGGSETDKKNVPVRCISVPSNSFSQSAPLDETSLSRQDNSPLPFDALADLRDFSPQPYDERCAAMGREVVENSSWDDTASFITPRQQKDDDDEDGILWGEEGDHQPTLLNMVFTSKSEEEELPFDECYMDYRKMASQTRPPANKSEMKKQKEERRQLTMTALYQLLSSKGANDNKFVDKLQDDASRQSPSNSERKEADSTQPPQSPTAMLDFHLRKALSKIKTSIEEHKTIAPILRDLSCLASNKEAPTTDRTTTDLIFSAQSKMKKQPNGSPSSSKNSLPSKISTTPKGSPQHSAASTPPKGSSPMPRGRQKLKSFSTLMSTPRRTSPQRPIGRGSPSSCESSTVFGGLDDLSIDSSPGAGKRGSLANRFQSPIIREKAATTIQRTFRGFLTRLDMEVRLETLSVETAALVIQAAWLSRRAERLRSKSTEQEAGHMIDTVLMSDDGCEVLLENQKQPVQLQPIHLKRTISMGQSLTISPSCAQLRCPSPCDDEDDLFLCTPAVDGEESSAIVWETSPPRKDFDKKRMEMVMLPSICEEDPGEEASVDEPGCCEEDVWKTAKSPASIKAARSPGSSTRGCSSDLEQELLLLETASWGSSRLVPPPQLHRKASFPGNDGISLPSSDDETNEHRASRLPFDSFHRMLSPSVLANSTWENSLPFSPLLLSVEHTKSQGDESDFSEPLSPEGHQWQRIFGIVELSVWLQAVARGLRHRRKYLELRKAVVCIQTRFRDRQRKSRLEQCAVLIQRWARDQRRRRMPAVTSSQEKTCQPSPNVHPKARPTHRRTRSDSSRPPLYPEIASPRSPKSACSPWRVKNIRNLPRSDTAALQVPFPWEELEAENDSEKGEASPAVSWPVPISHYHHRTRLLGLQKTDSVAVSDRELARNTPPATVKETQNRCIKSQIETFAADLAECHSLQNLCPWTECYPTPGCEESDFDISKNGATIDRRRRLASAVSKHKIAKNECTRHSSAVVLQRFLRSAVQCKRLLKYKKAAVEIQRIIRGWLVRKKYCLKIQQIVRTQGLARTYLAKWKFTRTRVMKLQSAARTSICRENDTLCYNTQVLERMLTHRRAWLLSTSSAVRRIQPVVRGWLCRRKLKACRSVEIQNHSVLRGSESQANDWECMRPVTVIQTFRRQEAGLMHETAVIQRDTLLRRARAVSIVQRFAHRCATQRHLELAAVSVQTFFRGRMAHSAYSRCLDAAKTIQRYQRRRSARQRWEACLDAVLKLQRTSRAIACRSAYMKCRKAAITLQVTLRLRLAQTNYEKSRKAAITVQATQRRRHAQKSFGLCILAATKIQVAHRRSVCRSSYLMCLKMIVTLQRRWRRRLFQRDVVLCLNASRQIQYIHRRAVVAIQSSERRRVCRAQYVNNQALALKLQAIHRGIAVRNMLQNIASAAIILQKHIRLWLAKQRLLKSKSAALSIQSSFRRFECRKHHRRSLKAVITIQRFVRTTTRIQLYQKKLMEARHRLETDMAIQRSSERRAAAALLIQSVFRAFQTRLRYRRVVQALVSLQGHARTTLERNRFCTTISAVRAIQSFFKRYANRNLYDRHTKAIQSALLLHVAAKEKKLSFTKESLRSTQVHRAAIVLQRAARLMSRRRRAVSMNYDLIVDTEETNFASEDIAIQVEDCTWLSIASQCFDFQNDGAYFLNAEDFSGAFEDTVASPDNVTITEEPKKEYGSKSKRKRSSVPSKIVYATMMSAAIVACVCHSRVSIQPAQATSKTALELQLRALRSQMARLSGQHGIVQKIQESLFPRPMLAWEAESAEGQRFHRTQTEQAIPSIDNYTNLHDETEEMLNSHFSTLETVKRWQTAVRTLLEDASLQSYQAPEERNPTI